VINESAFGLAAQHQPPWRVPSGYESGSHRSRARVLAALRAAPPEDWHELVETLMAAMIRSPSAKTPR
jgi:hypothetical protein